MATEKPEGIEALAMDKDELIRIIRLAEMEGVEDIDGVPLRHIQRIIRGVAPGQIRDSSDNRMGLSDTIHFVSFVSLRSFRNRLVHYAYSKSEMNDGEEVASQQEEAKNSQSHRDVLAGTFEIIANGVIGSQYADDFACDLEEMRADEEEPKGLLSALWLLATAFLSRLMQWKVRWEAKLKISFSFKKTD